MTGTPVTLTDDAGRVRFEGRQQGGGGGSQTVKAVRVPIAFNTPNIVLTGIPLYVPTVGDLLIGFSTSLTTAWDGTTPQGYIGYPADSDYLESVALVQADAPQDAGHMATPVDAALVFGNASPPAMFADTVPLSFWVDDQSGGDPGSSQGAGEVILLILAAA